MKMNNACIVLGLSVSALLAGCATAPAPAPAPAATGTPTASAGPATPIRTPMPLPKGVHFGDEVDVLPKIIYQTAPMYPYALSSKGVSGRLVVVFFVLTDGTVSNARIKRSSHMEFERPALECVRQWRFEPAINDGVPVACQLEVPMTFNVQGL
jgi:TonB family protein